MEALREYEWAEFLGPEVTPADVPTNGCVFEVVQVEVSEPRDRIVIYGERPE